MNFSLTPRAERQLIDIFLYTVEHFGLEQANSYEQGIRNVFALLADNPRMGRPADRIRPGLRRHEHGEHVIFYRETAKALLIVTIIHRRMLPSPDLDDFDA